MSTSSPSKVLNATTLRQLLNEVRIPSQRYFLKSDTVVYDVTWSSMRFDIGLGKKAGREKYSLTLITWYPEPNPPSSTTRNSIRSAITDDDR